MLYRRGIRRIGRLPPAHALDCINRHTQQQRVNRRIAVMRHEQTRGLEHFIDWNLRHRALVRLGPHNHRKVRSDLHQLRANPLLPLPIGVTVCSGRLRRHARHKHVPGLPGTIANSETQLLESIGQACSPHMHRSVPIINGQTVITILRSSLRAASPVPEIPEQIMRTSRPICVKNVRVHPTVRHCDVGNHPVESASLDIMHAAAPQARRHRMRDVSGPLIAEATAGIDGIDCYLHARCLSCIASKYLNGAPAATSSTFHCAHATDSTIADRSPSRGAANVDNPALPPSAPIHLLNSCTTGTPYNSALPPAPLPHTTHAPTPSRSSNSGLACLSVPGCGLSRMRRRPQTALSRCCTSVTQPRGMATPGGPTPLRGNIRMSSRAPPPGHA